LRESSNWYKTQQCRYGIGGDANLELVDKFCYLGDMLGVDRDADAAVETRIRAGWNKFRQLVPMLINKDISLKDHPQNQHSFTVYFHTNDTVHPFLHCKYPSVIRSLLTSHPEQHLWPLAP